MSIKTVRPNAPDGTYWIDPDGAGGTAAYQVHCLMDSLYDGGGWTLVAVSTDDGQDTWTWNNRNYWDTDTSTFGSLNALNRDFKSPALHEVSAKDVMFVHAPSGVWAGYNDVSAAGDSLATTIGNIGSRCYGTERGFALSAGTLAQAGNLCDTDLYISPQDQDGTSSCGGPSSGANSYGPAWSARTNNSCPLDDPGAISSLSGVPAHPDIEGNTSATLPLGNQVGFGWALSLNTGTTGTGQNNMRVYVRGSR